MAVHAVEHFIRFQYTSAYGTHTMDRPTRPWVGTPWAEAGTYLNWAEVSIPADDMAQEFAALMAAEMPEGMFVDGYTIYSTIVPGDAPIPVWAENLAYEGSSVLTSQSRAWGKVFTLRDSMSQRVSLELLDVPCGGLASRYTALTDANDIALVAHLIDADNAWSSRADNRPVFLLSLVTDTNEALLAKYGIN